MALDLSADVAPWTTEDALPCGTVVDAANEWAPATSGDPDGGLVDMAIVVASGILFDLSGRQWPGVVEDTVRPVLCRHGRRACGCPGAVPAWRFPRTPVLESAAITVTVDGEALDSSAYVVVDGVDLVRTDGEGWPTRQDLRKASTEVGTWEVTYPGGAEPPTGGELAARALTCELLRWYLPREVLSEDEGACRWPRRLTSVTRQGVTMQGLASVAEMFGKGRTGLPEVDLWLDSLNVGRSRTGGGVVVPEHLVSGSHRSGRRRP